MSANTLLYGCLLLFIRKPCEEALLMLMARTLPISVVVAVALIGRGAAPG